MTSTYRSRRQATHKLPFIGVDGEGGTAKDGLHRYGSLRIGDNLLMHDDGSALLSAEIFEFILGQSKARFVGYGLNYDFTHWMYDLPYPKLKSLRERGWIWWDGYRIACIANKYFEVGRKGSEKRIIYDVLGIFQTSFLKALETWGVGTEEDHVQIREGKLKRGTFVLPLDKDVEAYNILEVSLLQRLMDAVDKACLASDIQVQRWHGAGAIAEALLHKYGVGEYIGELPENIQTIADYAYFGGRFDIVQYGNVGSLWEYDIISAYPAAMVSLPCLVHGTWEYIDNPGCMERMGPPILVFVYWKVSYSAQLPWGPLPVRQKDGRIVYPLEGQGWYFWEEVDEARKVWSEGTFVFGATCSYRSDCTHVPFEFIPSVFKDRQKLGKSKEGIILKLALNSLYGKTAQQEGVAPFAQSIWAGLITARTRARLMPLLKLAGKSGIMTATDAVYSTERLNIDLGENLGDWEEHGPGENTFIAQTGVYFSEGLQLKKIRGRGIALSLLDSLGVEGALRQAWEVSGPLGEVELGSLGDIGKGFVTWAMAAHFPAYYKRRGQWESRKKKITLLPTGQKSILPLQMPERMHLYPFESQFNGYPRQKSRAETTLEDGQLDFEYWDKVDWRT